jgi:hypothetical protein
MPGIAPGIFVSDLIKVWCPTGPLREQARSHKGAHFKCGSEPAREGVDLVDLINIERAIAATVCSLYRRIHHSKETLTCPTL